ncbi:hypothetical protein VNO80_19630 [Phaseolus coccineus]|uniref:NADH-ubiquinone oxidoreductase chain 3 n=1 Tax=Phaseolus coccineus TaxID=3886 RepID=A0AAN9R0E8_PHACN
MGRVKMRQMCISYVNREVLAFLISGILAPISKGPEKISSYESGIEPIGDAWLQFRIRYYMFALIFVVFDVETVFLYPWAMSFDVLGVSVFLEAFLFVLILIVGSVYAWRKGALEWSPSTSRFWLIFFLAQTLPIVCLVDEIGVPGEEEEKEDLNRKVRSYILSTLSRTMMELPG